ncbi:uncharacterized protein LOC112904395 [Agrilus planipennis]|uniref:Uncharacterized protein LOC112904395 n=1 Tax=Agrilus planipennis TaxID=224129 RepID=A0A7F5R3D0_AGRPL|nr:uncharacterized protein LOC112904395 [Agrilus planipennis]
MEQNEMSAVNQNLLKNQHELLKLAELAGIQANPVIFWISIQLLNMMVEPEAIYKLLKLIIRKNKKSVRNRMHSDSSTETKTLQDWQY